jgi:hypothetical protein
MHPFRAAIEANDAKAAAAVLADKQIQGCVRQPMDVEPCA